MKEDNENFRRVIVSKFLDKLGNVEMKDADILPALEDYAQTGNREMFEEFSKFHYAKEGSKKESELKLDIEILKSVTSTLEKQLEDRKKVMKKIVDDYNKYVRDFRSSIEAFEEWSKNMKEKLMEEGIKSQYCGLKWSELSKIINEKFSGHQRNKSLYVSMEDGVHLVKQVYFDDNCGIVLSIEDSCFPIFPYTGTMPRSVRYNLTDYLPYSFRVNIYSEIEYLASREVILSNDEAEI